MDKLTERVGAMQGTALCPDCAKTCAKPAWGFGARPFSGMLAGNHARTARTI